jgi:hypothetical protein
MIATVTNLKPVVKPIVKSNARYERASKRARTAARRQAMVGMGIGAVACSLTALSLSHLAHGVEIVTHAPTWEAWAMAVGIDLGFVALELSQLACNAKVSKQVGKFAKPAILGTLTGSAAMNAMAFAGQAETIPMQVVASVVGVAIPTLIYALTRVGAAIWLDTKSN